MQTGKEVNIGKLNMVHLRAVEILDPAFSQVAALGNVKEVRIAEVWLMPFHSSVITEDFLAEASFNSIEEFLDSCRGDPGKEYEGFAAMLRHKLLAYFFGSLSPHDTTWHMCVRAVKGGQVISVIFGHRILLDRARAEGYISE